MMTFLDFMFLISIFAENAPQLMSPRRAGVGQDDDKVVVLNAELNVCPSGSLNLLFLINIWLQAAFKDRRRAVGSTKPKTTEVVLSFTSTPEQVSAWLTSHHFEKVRILSSFHNLSPLLLSKAPHLVTVDLT
jgi:hypothetical protein